MSIKGNQKIKPFLKWPGGKRQILQKLEARFPKHFQNYFEPFVGAGSVVMHILNHHNFKGKIHINDKNVELITTYNEVINNTSKLVSWLKKHQKKNSKKYFLKIRAKDRKDSWFTKHREKNKTFVASRMIYLNKVCFNGLYRLNKVGQFNTPYGKYKKPLIMDENNLKLIAQKMKNVKITNYDFDYVKSKAKKGDLVYFDPPYIPKSKTASFVAYTLGGFGKNEQVRLKNLALELTWRGVKVILSNSDTKLARDLYDDKDFKIHLISARRSINSNGNKRKGRELIIVNSVVENDKNK